MANKQAVRGNMEVDQIKWWIRSAKMGHPNEMATVYRWLAAALRAGTITDEEIEFIAARLVAVADAVPAGGIGDDKAAKTAVCHALLIARGRAKKTRYDAETDSFRRAYAMKELIDAGLDHEAASEKLATDAGVGADPRPFLKSWNEYESGFDLDGDGHDAGGDPRL